MATSLDSIGIFDDCVPADFLRDTLRCLIDSYRLAWEECRASYPWTEAHDVVGYIRRAKFEAQWREVAKRYPTLTATAETNVTGNCHHTAISGGRVIMTASKVEKPEQLVKDAIFRQTYARSGQLTMFDEDDLSGQPASDAPLYAILIHAPAEPPSAPYFSHVVFPSPDCRQYVARIRLEERFPELFLADSATGIEDVRDEARVELRDDIETRDRKNA